MNALVKNWKKSSAFRRNLVAGSLIGIGALFVAAYMIVPKEKRVGYKSPKVTMEYVLKTDDPVINTSKGMPIYGNRAGCHAHTPLGSPDVSSLGLTNAVMVCHGAYAGVFNLETKTPVVVSHVLKRTDFLKGKYVERESEFTDDPYANGERNDVTYPTSKDYKGTGFDRGHLMPAADASHDEEFMKETFYMTNIAPQAPQHNRGIWARLEKDIRELLKRGKVCIPVPDKKTFDALEPNEKCAGTAEAPYQMVLDFEELYVTTGVLYHISKNPKEIPQIGNPQDGSLGVFKSGVKIPNYFYKIIIEPRTGMSAAYLIPNVPQVGNANYHQFHIPLTKLEEIYTKMKFYNGLDKKVLAKVKRYYIVVDEKTKKAELTGGRNGMLDRFLF